MASSLDDDRITAAGLLLEAAAALERALTPRIEAYGLSPPRFEVLMRLARTPGHRLRMSELASAMTSISPSGLTRLVDRLEADGLVERATCPDDRRGAYAVLTADGLDRVEQVAPAHVDDIDRYFTSRFTSRQLDVLLRALRIIRDDDRS